MIIGIDEVGRGCWAGPLVAGAVILGQDIAGLADSKALTSARRDTLAAEIHAQALAVGLGWVTPEEVDTIGLTKAVSLAMHRAVDCITIAYDNMIIDGNINYFPENLRAQAIIKADGSIPCVSAASIVAKVARDKYMQTTAHDAYPMYGFASHVGYGTKAHVAMLEKYGVTDIHRKSYKPIQKLLV